MTRLPVRSAAIVFAALLAGASCGPAVSTSPAVAPPSRPATATADVLTIPQLEQLWADTGSGGGGYRSTPNLLAPPSLYLTAWMLRIVDWYGASVPQLSRPHTVSWLRAVLDRPDNADEALPRLERAWLAGQALAALREPVPAGPVARLLSTLRAGTLYRYGPQQSPSWPATQTAIELMRLAGLPAPSETAHALAGQLPAVGDPARASRLSDLTVLDTLLPVWQLADLLLPDSSRARFRGPLGIILAALAARAAAPEVSAPLAASLLINARQIARANGITLPPTPAPPFLALRTPGGFLSLSASTSTPDPQLTYDAALLGTPLDDALLATIRRTAGPTGWQANAGPVDPQTTFEAAVIAHALGHHEHDGALRILTLAWLAQVASGFPAAATTSLTQLRAAFFVLALAREVGLPIPRSLAASVRMAMAALPTPGQISREAWLLRLGDAIGIAPPEKVRQAILRIGQDLKVRSMQDIYTLQVAAEATRSAALAARAIDGARSLAFGAAYRFTPGAPAPDLRSTSLGIAIVGASPAVRQDAIAPFSSAEGIWMFPATQASGNIVTPESIYLGYVVLGRVTDAAGIFFYD